MALRDTILPEFDAEMSITRKVLERVPEGKSDWKPHEKSMTLGRLAGHIAELPRLGLLAMTTDSFDVRSADRPAPIIMTSRKVLLDTFDKHVAATRQAIAGASDETLLKPWALQAAGKTLFSAPRAGVLRTFCIGHIIHHRGELSVYLRLNDAPVPSIYGPSADDNPFTS